MKLTQVYEVSFNVFLDDPNTKWKTSRRHNTRICASSLNEILTDWVPQLLKAFPYEDGTGGSHYSTDPVYGKRIEFVEIKKIVEAALVSEAKE